MSLGVMSRRSASAGDLRRRHRDRVQRSRAEDAPGNPAYPIDNALTAHVICPAVRPMIKITIALDRQPPAIGALDDEIDRVAEEDQIASQEMFFSFPADENLVGLDDPSSSSWSTALLMLSSTDPVRTCFGPTKGHSLIFGRGFKLFSGLRNCQIACRLRTDHSWTAWWNAVRGGAVKGLVRNPSHRHSIGPILVDIFYATSVVWSRYY